MDQLTYAAVIDVLQYGGQRRYVDENGYYISAGDKRVPRKYEFTLGYSTLSTITAIGLRLRERGVSGNQRKIKEVLNELIISKLIKTERVSAFNKMHTTYIPTDLFYLLIR